MRAASLCLFLLGLTLMIVSGVFSDNGFRVSGGMSFCAALFAIGIAGMLFNLTHRPPA